MNNNLNIVRQFMTENDIKYLLVNSTNEFLVEYNSLDENSRYKITGFSGSTGDALVTSDRVFLFVDGRYHIQADNEVDSSVVTVVKLTNAQNQTDEIINLIPKGEVLGIFSKKNSQKRIEYFSKKCEIKLLDNDPLDGKNSDNSASYDVSLPVSLTGLSTDEKIEKITADLKNDECLYITDLDEVSYVFNMRNFSKNYSSKIFAKAIVSKNEKLLFKKNEQEKLEKYLKDTEKTVVFDKNTINNFDYNIIKLKSKPLETNKIQLMKSQKTFEELEHLKEAFKKSDNALKKTREFILKSDKVSEYEIAQFLEKSFIQEGAKCLSFKSIVAKDKNSALAHYSKNSKTEIISDGNLVLIDCGAYFEGGLATDMTRVFVKGEPTELHKKIYTHVLKAFLLAYNWDKTHSKRPFSGYETDNAVHKYFDSADVEGFVFNHGLGHGIGVNVHEYPPKLSTHEISKVEIKEGMCFSIEPGLYKEGFFGVRLENSCYFKDGEIHSFSGMNFEKKLIDFDNLTEEEKNQLREFEVI